MIGWAKTWLKVGMDVTVHAVNVEWSIGWQWLRVQSDCGPPELEVDWQLPTLA